MTIGIHNLMNSSLLFNKEKYHQSQACTEAIKTMNVKLLMFYERA